MCREERRYSTGSETSEVITSHPVIGQGDNLSNLSVGSSSRPPTSLAVNSDLADPNTIELDDCEPPYEEPMTMKRDMKLNLMQYIIPTSTQQSDAESCPDCEKGCSSDVQTNGRLSAFSAPRPNSACLDNSLQSTVSSTSRPQEGGELSSPLNHSTPNLQFEPGYPAPLPHACSSPVIDEPSDTDILAKRQSNQYETIPNHTSPHVPPTVHPPVNSHVLPAAYPSAKVLVEGHTPVNHYESLGYHNNVSHQVYQPSNYEQSNYEHLQSNQIVSQPVYPHPMTVNSSESSLRVEVPAGQHPHDGYYMETDSQFSPFRFSTPDC